MDIRVLFLLNPMQLANKLFVMLEQIGIVVEDIVNELTQSGAGYDEGAFAERCNVHLAEN